MRKSEEEIRCDACIEKHDTDLLDWLLENGAQSFTSTGGKRLWFLKRIEMFNLTSKELHEYYLKDKENNTNTVI